MLQFARWFGSALVLCGAMAVAGAQFASSARTEQAARTILAQMREASGGDAWNRVGEIDSESTILAGGRTGRLLVRYDLRTGANWDRVEMQDAGRLEEHNVGPAEDWALDGAGDVTLSPGSKIDAEIDDLYIHRRGWWQPQFGGATIALGPQQRFGDALCDVLSVHVPGGRGFALWVNTQTHQLVRLQGKDGDGRYSDFRRTASGLTLPFREERGDPAKPVVFVTTRLDTRAQVNAADFAPPFHNDYTMPASGQVTVPAEGGVLFDLRLNGKGPFRAVFDTGGVNGMSRGMADRLGLKVEDKPVPFGAIGGTITAHTARIENVTVGDLTLHDQLFYVLDLPETAGTPQLLVGWEWMRRFAVRVDPERNQLTLLDGSKFRYTGSGTPVPLMLNQHGNGAEIEATIEGAPGRFTLDTGNQMGTFVNAQFAEEHKLVAITGATYRGYNGRGFGGDSPEAWIARAKTFTIGNIVLHDPVVRLQTGTDAMYSNAGNIGQDILNRFVLVLDTLHSTMYLEKTRRWDERAAFNRAGIVYDPNDGVDHIKTVLQGGPGEAAGLRVGDEILSVDGKPPTDDPNDPVFTQRAGTVLQLRIRRSGAEQVVPVTLRDVL